MDGPAVQDLSACLADGHLPLVDTRSFECDFYGRRSPRFLGGGMTCPRCKTTFEHPDGGNVLGAF